MKTNSIDWVNGQYYLVKKYLSLASVAGTGPFGYLTMQEIAMEADLNRNYGWTGYWESPRKALACTFRAVRLERNLPFLFMPVTYVCLDSLLFTEQFSDISSRLGYVMAAERHSGLVRTSDREFTEYVRAINRPIIGLRTIVSRRVATNPVEGQAEKGESPNFLSCFEY
jgi:hypothetical protein